MKKTLVLLLIVLACLIPLMANGAQEKTVEEGSYPPGTVIFWGTGQPKFRTMYYDRLAKEISPDLACQGDPMKTMNDGVQKISMYELAGDTASMPDFIMLDPVSLLKLAGANLLVDQTEYWNTVKDEFLPGVADDATVNGKVWGLPDAVRPQVLFYNAAIFEKYDVDPAMMSTFEGYLEAGRLLKERSNGEVFLSYEDPGSYTWRYWGRRGLMPQAKARIWDDEGNVVIGSDPGAKLAFEYFDKLHSEGLLYKTKMMQQPLYEATDEGKIATFYIGAFWDEFLRKNLTATAGDWRVMNAPVFEEVGLGGAPVATYYCIIDKKPATYEDLIHEIWYDFMTNLEDRNAWTAEMDEIKGPYSNPISTKILADPFWQTPSEFYGGQSFKKAESDGLVNPAKNMTVTESDVEADKIISAELEKYIAGEQNIQQAIANMDANLKLKIGKAVMP